MPRRKTIGKDPLGADVPVSNFPHEARASIIGVESRPAQRLRDIIAFSDGITRGVPMSHNKYRQRVGARAKADLALGGRLEIIGGDFGIGSCIIGLLDGGKYVGFVTPSGRVVDLHEELDTIVAWPDRTEHRFLSAAGWGWALGILAGPVGIVLGAGVRLLHPRRMLLELRLRGRGVLVARTDLVTVRALEDLALNQARN